MGSEGTKYINAAKMVIERTKKLFNHFKEKNPDGTCILISDHGMGDVLTGVDVLNPMKRLLGSLGKNIKFIMTRCIYGFGRIVTICF